MSIAIRTKRLNPSSLKSTSNPIVPAAIKVRSESEAPERAAYHHEAPESRPGHPAEAPDSGVGRHGYLEHEFTHGRSQS